MDVSVRDATPTDAEAIAGIYNHYVTGSSATFDIDPVTTEGRLEWLAGRSELHPVLVAVRTSDGSVVGWGAVSPWAERGAWHRTVEVSVYVRSDARSGGVGRALMDALIERARQAGHHALLAQIVFGNEPSLSMADSMGFERVGVLREVGEKFGRWHDIVIVERILDS